MREKPMLEKGSTNKVQTPFKVEAKIDITSYVGEIDTHTLNQWLQQLEVYFIVREIGKEQRISFA